MARERLRAAISPCTGAAIALALGAPAALAGGQVHRVPADFAVKKEWPWVKAIGYSVRITQHADGRETDEVRYYILSRLVTASEFATRLAGSSDLYQADGRKPYASIDFITCHDGFTLQDLVSYNEKHNEANKEGNRDGANDNNSWNCGSEGPSDDPAVKALRGRQKANLMATLLLSQLSAASPM